TARPGKHTLTLYDTHERREASILAQLRTGMARLNGYLHRACTSACRSVASNKPNLVATSSRKKQLVCGPMCLRASKRNYQTFPLSMHEVDNLPRANATANRHKKK